MQELSDAQLSKLLLLACRALMIVDGGVSERESVARALASDPGLRDVRSKSLILVLEIVREQDLLDRLVKNALSTETRGTYAKSILRMAAYLARRAKNQRELTSLERSLRKVAAIEYLPKVESLLGTLSASNNHSLISGLRETEQISLNTQNPAWWVEYCVRTFGRREAIDLLSANSRPRYVRINPLRNRGRSSLPREARPLTDNLSEVQGVQGVYIVRGPLSALSKFFTRGLFQTQDLASFLAIWAADPQPREEVLDLCAAPGGKTAAAAQLMKNRGRIVSVDYSRPRMRTWKREVFRLGVKIAEPVIGDAARLGIQGSFDLVVVDPPCTGTGILDRNPSMKWRISPQAVDGYAALQEHFLNSASSIVADDGRILYCTCSLTLEENEQVISRFLKSHLEFETTPVLGEFGSPALRGMSDCRRFYPHRDRTAGYFIARLQRVN